jgi:hypothetical protein
MAASDFGLGGEKMNQTPPTHNPSLPPASAMKKAIAPAAGALAGTSAMVLLMELARSGALAQYKDLLAPLIGWGPGLAILAGFLWLAHAYAPPLIESQRSTAMALQKLADTVERNDSQQHDLVLAMQVNSDKLEQLRSTVADLQDEVRQMKPSGHDFSRAEHSARTIRASAPEVQADPSG